MTQPARVHHAKMQPESDGGVLADNDVATIRDHGFVVVPALLPSDVLAAIRAALRPHLQSDLLYRIDFNTAPTAARAPAPPAPLPADLESQLRDVEMSPGSVIVFLGTLVHRGGANCCQRPRLALSNQYCEPWARQQENYILS